MAATLIYRSVSPDAPFPFVLPDISGFNKDMGLTKQTPKTDQADRQNLLKVRSKKAILGALLQVGFSNTPSH